MPFELFTAMRQGQRNTIAATFRTNDIWAKKLKVSERRRLYRVALERTLAEWRDKFLWKRINKDTVRRHPFNYQRGGNAPMIGPRRRNDPQKLINAIWTGKTRARIPTATKETDPIQVSASVTFPFGHPVKPAISRVFKSLPRVEIVWIADRFAQLVAAERELTETVDKGKRRGMLKLSPEQRQRMKSQPRSGGRSRARR